MAWASFLSLPVIYLNVERLAEALGWDSLLVDATGVSGSSGMTGTLIDILVSPAMAMGSIALVSFSLGVWVDTWIRQREPAKVKRPEALRLIGKQCELMAYRIKSSLDPGYFGPGYKNTPQETVAATYSLLLTLDKQRIPAPTQAALVDLRVINQVENYFRMIGKLLIAGHIREAEVEAIQMTVEIMELSENRMAHSG